MAKARLSAGLLLYHLAQDKLELLLVHPGGPFWRNKDTGAWTIPKGEPAEGEDLLEAAKREFEEELGVRAPPGPFVALAPVKQKGGKIVHAWACEGDIDVSDIRSNTATVEWPPRSGKFTGFPEVDRAAFFSPDTARLKINPAQASFIDEVERIVSSR